MQLFKNLSLVILLLAPRTEATLVSEIFTYDDPASAKNLHVSLQGESCQMRSLVAADLPLYQNLFSNPTAMSKLGHGELHSFERTAGYVQRWISRFQEGHPHSNLILSTPESPEQLGYVMARADVGVGVSEISFALLPEHWGKRLTTHAVTAMVHQWAPEVRRIGLGVGLDAIQDAAIIKAFQCFENAPLETLYATARPANPGSWKIFDRLNFQPSALEAEDAEPVLNFDHQEFASLDVFESKILESFTSSEPLKTGVHYSLVDPEGRVRTFSKHEEYGSLRYHFEKTLTDLA